MLSFNHKIIIRGSLIVYHQIWICRITEFIQLPFKMKIYCLQPTSHQCPEFSKILDSIFVKLSPNMTMKCMYSFVLCHWMFVNIRSNALHHNSGMTFIGSVMEN